MSLCLAFLIVTTVSFVSKASGHQTPCNVGNDTACLNGVRQYLTSTNWWFGVNYTVNCPVSLRDKVASCMNPDINQTTIMARLLQRNDYDVNKIQQFLRMRYNFPGDSYLTCGHRFDVASYYQDIDVDNTHTSHLDQIILTKRPTITWTADPGAVYTLIAYNVGDMTLAGLWVNIAGADSVLGTELYPHVGPINPINRVNIQAYVLFKQNGSISETMYPSIQQHLLDSISVNRVYRLNNLFRIITQIYDPIAMGYQAVTADAYGVSKGKDKALINNCPLLIYNLITDYKTIIAVHNLTGGAAANNLEVEVEVTYTSDQISFTYCCRDVTVSKRTLKIDPLSSTTVPTLLVRSKPFLKLSAVDMMNANFFDNKMFSVFLLDVTAALQNVSSRSNSLMWFVMDLTSQYITSGMEHVSYRSPVPPLDRAYNSVYAFFVFRHSSSLMSTLNLGNYCNGTNPCNLNLYKLMTDFNLTLSGFNWFKSNIDGYSRLKSYETNSANMDAACAGISGYSKPCPDPCQTMTTSTTQTVRSSAVKETYLPTTIACLALLAARYIFVSSYLLQ